jgi:LysM repeat protein
MRRSSLRLAFWVSALLLLAVSSLVVVPQRTAAQQAAQTTYVVQFGDTLFRIAVRNNTTVGALAQANGITNVNLIYVGQRLVIVGPGAPTPTPAPGTPTPPPTGTTTHTVVRGESLNTIAARYGVTVSAIVRANNIANPNLIFPGQRLVIPAPGATPPPATPGSTPTRAPGSTATPAPTAVPTQTVHIVQPGETLGTIARRYGTTITAIARANNIVNPNIVFVGQRLTIPAGGVVVTPVPTAPPGTPAPTQAGTLITGPGPIGGFELGGHVFGFSFPNEMRGAGMTWAKTQIRWNGTDPASIAQGPIDAARSRGFKILLSIVGDPAQLAANPTAYYASFASFLGGVAALRPDAIEVWNEMNIDREWPRGQISPQAYTQMLQAAFQAIKRANPGTLVISGAPAPTGFFGGQCTGNGCDDEPYIRGMERAGAANSADCIGVHYNEGVVSPNATSGDPRGNPNHYTRYFPTMVNLYARVFPNKPLCFTELGYLSPQGLGPLPAGFEWGASTAVQQQADWLARAATLSRQSGRIRMMIVWNVDATLYGADPQAGYAIVRNGTCLACLTLGAAMGVR